MAIYSTITLPVQKYNLCNTVGVSCSFCRLLPRTVWLCRMLKLVRRWIRIFSGHTDAEKEMSHGGKVIFSTLPCSKHTVIPSQSTGCFFFQFTNAAIWPGLVSLTQTPNLLSFHSMWMTIKQEYIAPRPKDHYYRPVSTQSLCLINLISALTKNSESKPLLRCGPESTLHNL